LPIELSTIKRQLQDHLQDGLLLVVGSGLSASEGIPTMGALAQHLKNSVPSHIAKSPDPGWDVVVQFLDAGDHLEAAMAKASLSHKTIEAIIQLTATLIREAEQVVVRDVITKGRVLPFAILAKHIFKVANKIHLVTPNYDRLVELAVEAAGVGVDVRFSGSLIGRSNPKLSADAHRDSYRNGKQAAFRSRPHLCVHKPHGSLDWFDIDGEIIRCPFEMQMSPTIITPGISKYRESFKWAFDDQRTAANKAYSEATRLMFIGYGFNDDHLEQYICPSLKLTKPAVIVAKDLSENARKVIKNSQGMLVIALSADSESVSRTRIQTSFGDDFVVNEILWNLDGFNRGVI
jgi:hypothetical protein